jgi:metallo-beta-lactamase family protein
MSPFPQILFHGATSGVTGSCHELRLAQDFGLLIDCGLFQGDEKRNSLEIDFPIAHIAALVVTHVHVDHIGRIPHLLAAGFSGTIYCSEASAHLLPLVLEDALEVGFTRNRRLIERFIARIERQLVAVTYGKWQSIDGGASSLRFKLKPAGHILGSSYVECDVQGRRFVFSGDLGAPYAPLLSAPRSPYRADVLVLESTYGDRLHQGRKSRKEKLRQIILRALSNRGAILIPAFSIGRTQELLYELESLIYHHRNEMVAGDLPWDDLEIILDSPLAARFTEVYKQLEGFWDAEAGCRIAHGRRPLSFSQLTTIDSHDEHLHAVKYVRKKARPCIVIAAGGMCAGGRIVDWLKALLGDERTDVVFVGYQAQGTPGRIIQKYGPQHGYVEMDDKRYTIDAEVHTLSGYSAHADQRNLVNFVKRMRRRPEKIYLVHGDGEAKSMLKKQLAVLLPSAEILIP